MNSPCASLCDWRTRLRQSLVILPVLSVICAAGCGGTLPAIADPQQARTTLQQALDAWKNGEPVESLQGRVPPIHVNDPDWREKKPLVAYEILAGQEHGNSWSCDVQLTLKDRAGEAAKQRANYTVDTSPRLVIVRDVTPE